MFAKTWNNLQAQSVLKLVHSSETFYCDDVWCWSFISFIKGKISNEKFKRDQISFLPWISRIWISSNLTGMLFACFKKSPMHYCYSWAIIFKNWHLFIHSSFPLKVWRELESSSYLSLDLSPPFVFHCLSWVYLKYSSLVAK